MNAYTDSVEAAQNRIQVAIEKWALFIDGADAMKVFYNTIAVAIENIQWLIGIIGGLAMLTSAPAVINSLIDGGARLAAKMTSVGMAMDRIKSGYANPATGAVTSGKAYVQEEFVYAQQQLYAQSLQRATRGLDNTTTQNAINLQSAILANNTQTKETASKILLGKLTEDEIRTTTQRLSVDGLLMTADQRLAMAKALSEMGLQLDHQSDLQLISQKASNLSALEQEEIILKSLNQARGQMTDQLRKNMARNIVESTKASPLGSFLGGIGMIGGGIWGGSVVGSAASNIWGLEGAGQMIGTTIGGIAGSYALQSIASSLPSIISSVAAGGGIVAALSPLAIPIGIVVGLGVLAGFANSKAKAKKEIESLAQETSAQIDKFNEYQTASVKTARYDELAKGVDSLGKNLTLTDDEYSEFLSIGNELAETFPDLVVKTDSAGNSFVGLGGTVSGVTKKVEELIEKQRHLANQALLAPDLLNDSYSKAKKDYDKLLDEKDRYEELSDVDFDKNAINGKAYITTNSEMSARNLKEYLQDNGVITELANPKHQGGSGDILSINEKDIEKADKLLTDLADKAAQTDRQIEQVRNSLNDELAATIEELEAGYYSDKIDSSIFGDMSENERMFINNVVKTDLTLEDGDAFITDVANQITAIHEEVAKNPAVLDIIYNLDTSKSAKAFAESRTELLNMLLAIFGDSLDEKEMSVLIGFGFELKDGAENPTDADSWIDTEDYAKRIMEEDLPGQLKEGFDINSSKYNYSVDELKQGYELLKNSIEGAKYSEQQFFEAIVGHKYRNAGPKELAKYYEDYVEFADEYEKNSAEEKRFEEIKKNLDSWAKELGVVQGDYDGIINKLKIIGELTPGGTSEMTPEEVQDKFGDYSKFYDYMENDFNGTWDAGTLASMSQYEDLIPYIGKPEEMKAALKAFLDDGEDLYNRSIQNVLYKTEEGSKVLKEANADAVKQFAEDYEIDLNNFKTLKDAEVFIQQYTNGIMNNNMDDWVAAMSTYYAKDLEKFTDANMQKLAMLSMVYAESLGISEVMADAALRNEYDGYEGASMTQEEKLAEIQKGVQKAHAKKVAQNLATMMADFRENVLKYNVPIGNLGGGSKSGSGSSKDTDPYEDLKKYLDNLQKLRSLIDKEWEAMEAYNEDTQEARPTEYFNKMRDALQAEIEAKEGALKTIANDKSEDATELRLDWEADLIDLKKQLKNLNDEEIEDAVKLLETQDASLETLIAWKKEYIKSADTEEELITRQKELNELVQKERDLRKEIREYHNKYIDQVLKYQKGTAYSESTVYDTMRNLQMQNYKADAEQALKDRQDAWSEAYNRLINEKDINGKLMYTAEEAYNKAFDDEKVRNLTMDYLEAIENQGNVIFDSIEEKVDEIQNKIDLLEQSKPKEWTNIDQIRQYTNETVSMLEQKIPLIEKALAESSMLTDEQIQDLVNELNEVTIAIHEAQIQALEDIKTYQETVYDGIVSKVEEYKEEISELMDQVEKDYDDQIDKLNDINDAHERTAKLIELENQLANAGKEKQRVAFNMPSIKIAI